MKRILMAVAGLLGLAAASQPVSAADYTAPSATDWNGGYFGGTVGLLNGRANWYVPGLAPSTVSSDTGFIAGLTGGFSWQDGYWVYGVEADWSWTNFDAGPMGGGCGGGCQTEIDWLATLRGRVGYASDSMLIYVTGGGAFARAGGYLSAVPGSKVASTEGGWTLGAGVEAKLDHNWSVKAEYLHVWLSDATVCTPPTCGVTNYSDFGSIHVFRGGVNYWFD